ncbi:MAG: plastocyanin [Planctomycetota bacterium]|jgi:plastocyanin
MMNFLTRAYPFLLLLIIGSCGDSADSKGELQQEKSVEATTVPLADSLGSAPYESAEFGAMFGEILIVGDVPDRFPIGARKMKECTHFPEVEHVSDIIIARDGKLQNVFVSIESGYDRASIPASSMETVEMNQVGCIYTPHVVALQTGQKLIVKNSDPTTHNVNLNAPKNKGNQNRGMVKGQEPLEFDFRREDRVKLKCDIHPWMSASVYVSRHPWFAVTGDDGSFSIKDVPPGEYVVVAEHEQFGTVRGKVVVEAGTSTGLALTLRAE